MKLTLSLLIVLSISLSFSKNHKKSHKVIDKISKIKLNYKKNGIFKNKKQLLNFRNNLCLSENLMIKIEPLSTLAQP